MVTRYFNGSIWQPDGFTTEIYVKAGLVSTNAVFLAAADQQEVNLHGATLLPAFRDGHAHPLFAGRELLSANITACRSIEEIGELLANFFKANPALLWLDAGSYDRSLPGSKTRQFLDSYVSEIPVVLHADDHHTIWVNTKALEVAGLLTNSIPAIAAGSIDVDDDGLPTGIFREFDAISLITKFAPTPTITDDVEALILADRKLLAAGLISVQDAWVVKGMVESYLAAEPELLLHYQLAFKLDPITFPEDFQYYESLLPRLQQAKNLKAQAMKFFVDGVFGSATARVSEPYLTGGYGDLNWNSDNLLEAINRTHQIGLQTHIHAIGDAAVDFALTALESANPGELNPVIAHAELVDQSLLERARKLGVTLCVQPYWAQYNGMLNSCITHLGETRTANLYPFRDAIDSKINLAFSSDWPVSNYAPLEGLAVAIHRRTSAEQTAHNPRQAITLHEAVNSYSCSVQRMLGEKVVSDLSVGTPFDAVLIDSDLKSEDLEGFLAAKVFAVYRNGYKLFPHH